MKKSIILLCLLLASGAVANAQWEPQWNCRQWGQPLGEPSFIGLGLYKVGFTRLLGVRCEKAQDDSVWAHIYHPQRLQVIEANATVTGTIVDATHGKRKQGCRSEADGDLHCWLKLDAGQDKYINAENVKNQGGNLVFEPICQHRVTQANAKAACKNYKQPITIPPVGSHVRMTGDSVLDTQHGHMEIHPAKSIEVRP